MVINRYGFERVRRYGGGPTPNARPKVLRSGALYGVDGSAGKWWVFIGMDGKDRAVVRAENHRGEYHCIHQAAILVAPQPVE